MNFAPVVKTEANIRIVNRRIELFVSWVFFLGSLQTQCFVFRLRVDRETACKFVTQAD